jgi:predicted transcriptional regulator
MLNLRELQRLLGGELLTPEMNLETECSKIFASDLMSDVLAFMHPGSVLVTGLVNAHAVRTACLADVAAIVYIQGKRPDATVMEEAVRRGLPIMTTRCSMFEACSLISKRFPEGGG